MLEKAIVTQNEILQEFLKNGTLRKEYVQYLLSPDPLPWHPSTP